MFSNFGYMKTKRSRPRSRVDSRGNPLPATAMHGFGDALNIPADFTPSTSLAGYMEMKEQMPNYAWPGDGEMNVSFNPPPMHLDKTQQDMLAMGETPMPAPISKPNYGAAPKANPVIPSPPALMHPGVVIDPTSQRIVNVLNQIKAKMAAGIMPTAEENTFLAHLAAATGIRR